MLAFKRAGLAGVVGILAAGVMVLVVPEGFERRSDFLWSIHAARDWMGGRAVYGAVPSAVMIPYPFTAAVIAMPLALLPIKLGVSLFVGGGAAALGMAVTRGPWWRAGILVSSSFYIAVQTSQWSTWYTAALAYPTLLCLVVAKPQFALLAICRWPTRWAVGLGVLIAAASLVMLPEWPRLWLRQLGPYEGFVPILVAPWLALGALRWRDPRARLLLVMACMPQHKYWYDQLPLYLICATPRQMLWMLTLGWAGLGLGFAFDFQGGAALILGFLYLPALFVVWLSATPAGLTEASYNRIVNREGGEAVLSDKAGLTEASYNRTGLREASCNGCRASGRRGMLRRLVPGGE